MSSFKGVSVSSKSYFNYLLLLLLTILLASCSHHVVRQDGPPDFYVDETKIPNAVPKPEKLSKYGNYSSYSVFGKNYHTLKTSKNYEEVGIASWYGMLYQHHPTSNGERYDVVAMTAAHKTLPLPTYVEVTNLKNHRKVIVKVNDRGPFEGNRLIDLSYVAAKKLGMLAHGTALVRVKAIDPLTYGHHGLNVHFAKNNKPLYIQVGAFKNKAHAQRLRQRLMGMLTEPVNIAAAQHNQIYKVQVGPIKDLAQADQISHQLNLLGIKPNKKYGI